MSGGHFDYYCFHISQFADELRHEIDINYDETKDEWGDTRGANFDAATMDNIEEAHALIDRAASLAKEIEWLYSGDTSPQYFNLIIRELLDATRSIIAE